MRYASVMDVGGTETVAVVLPLSAVPLWDPRDPRPGTYLVPDEVCKGWIRRGDTFVPPPPQEGEGGEG